MILATAAILIGTGLALFGIGYFAERPEIAMFGALIIIAVGGTVATSGLEVRTGEVTNINDTQNGSTEVVDYKYQKINVHTDFPLGIVLLLLGAIMLMTGAGRTAEADEGGSEWEKR